MGEVFTVTLGGLDLTTTDAFGVSWRCTQLDGWAGSPASTLAPVQKVRGPGAWLSPRQMTPRTVVVGGLIDAADTVSAREAVDRLNAAVSLDGAAFTVTESGDLTRYCTVYRQDEVLTGWVTDTLVQWSAQMTAVDPRKFTDPLTTTTLLPSTSGGLSFPITFPLTFPAVTVTGRCSLTNPGIVTGPVKLRIDGPIVGPQVTHLSTGLALVFASSLTLAAGEWIDVDMEAQTVLANGQSSRNAFVTRREWFGFDPGVNEWDFAAVSGSGQLTVTATPAW